MSEASESGPRHPRDVLKAVRVAAHAAHLDPQSAIAWSRLATTLLWAQATCPGVEALGEARAHGPDAPWPDAPILAVLFAFARAVHLDPKLQSAWFKLGSKLAVLWAEGLGVEALRVVRDHSPDVPWPDAPVLAGVLAFARAACLNPKDRRGWSSLSEALDAAQAEGLGVEALRVARDQVGEVP